MRKTKNKRASSPNPALFQRGVGRVEPVALKRSPSTNASKRFDEDTIIWGENDSLPLEIIKSVEDSPTTSSCLEIRADFIRGAGFTDKSLESLQINSQGQTLWDIHCQFSEIMSVLEGFSALHKYNIEGGITEAYYIGFESLRFVKPQEDTDENMMYVKYNPFWGTQEFNKKFTKCYPLYDKEIVIDQIKEDKDFPGQIYYYGTTSPIYRFYTRPKYWSGERWIKADGKIQTFHDENLENGFFQSTLINVVGNPSDWSTNPKYQRKTTGTDGQMRTESTKTVGEEFNEMMSESFSGARKAGTAMVLWAQNKESAAQIQNFPTNTNADLLQGTFTDIIRGITIATKTPAILANLPQQVSSLGSDGASFQKAVEMMQTRTQWFRKQLEYYYNNVLLPGMGIASKVEIKPYQPVTVPVEIDDKVWEFLNDQEKQVFIKKNFNIDLLRAPVQPMQPLQPLQPTTPNPEQAKTNEALKNLNIADLNRIQKIVSRYNLYKNDPNNPKGLTYDQAKQMLTSYGFNEEELNAWLVTPEEDA